MKPFFSIVIPTLNEEKFLPNLLEDIKNQSFKDYEVIVVDGGSKDKTEEKVRNINNLSINFYKVKKQSASFQRNYGTRKAKGEYVFFVDADIRIEKNFLKTAFDLIEKHEYLIYIPYILPDIKYQHYLAITKLSNYAVEISQLTSKPLSNSGTMIVHRFLWKHLKGFNENMKLNEDHDFVERARSIGVQSYFARDLKIIFSLRRYEKEGLTKITAKYAVAIFNNLVGNKNESKMFSYEMGGLRYSSKEKEHLFDSFKKLYNKYKKQLEDFI